MSGKKGKFVVYVRVSSSTQEDGTSLETQEETCIELALAAGYSADAAVLLREIWTGATLDRPQLNKVRRMAAAREIEAVFVYTSDRMARDPVHLLMLMREFGDCGVDVQFVQEPSDSTPEGELVSFVRGYAGHRERAMIRERTVRAKDAMARGGVWPAGWKQQTYGYDIDPVSRKRVVNEEEAKVVRRIFRMYADGLSLYMIAAKLNEDGILSKTGKGWSVTVIKDVLSNESYIGVDYYGKMRSVGGERGKGKPVRVPREQWIEVRDYSPPLVSGSLSLRVQERLGKAQARRTEGNRYRYPLTGFVKCGKCGHRSVSGSGCGKGHWYYACSGAARRQPGLDKLCDSKLVPGKWMEEQVWNAVVSMVRDPSGVIADLKLSFETGGGDLGEEIKRLESEMARVKREEELMLGLYRRGTVREELLDAEMAKLSASRADSQSRLASLEQQRASAETVEEAGERIREYCQRVSAELDDLDVDGKRALMFRLGIKVVAVKGDLLITAELDSGFVVNEDTSLYD